MARAKDVSLVLSAHSLALGMLGHLSRQLPYADEQDIRDIPSDVVTLETASEPSGTFRFSKSASEFWPHFGEKRYFRVGRTNVEVLVPTVAAMLEEIGKIAESSDFLAAIGLESSVVSELGIPDKRVAFLSALFGHRPLHGQDRQQYQKEDLDRLLAFEGLPPESQRQHIQLLRLVFAFNNLFYSSFSEHVHKKADSEAQELDRLLRNFPTSTFGHFILGGISSFQKWVYKILLGKPRRELEQLTAEFEYFARLWGRFFQIYYWEDEPPIASPLREFLPKGLWPFMGAAEEAPANAQDNVNEPERHLDLGEEEEFQEDDLRIAPERLAFYQQLGCKRVVRPRGWFEKEGYAAYLIKTKSGRSVAVLDCNQYGHAAYLFWMRQNHDGDQWVVDAQATKAEVLQKAGEQGHTFIRRFIHGSGWEVRITLWVNAN